MRDTNSKRSGCLEVRRISYLITFNCDFASNIENCSAQKQTFDSESKRR